ncbi:hypothetical protein DAPPUDRAFT_303438 [Daphnia pulex]|uniref:Uncharacterized protein n=1 Tax=Daphnia pulex TaxID=6669 RepID=E9GGP3_DAPPU|nr:hypothetical protein DAPPUDRAFT_303438 [Daphnia pulex]|eukprot:EFX81427.1 hypothetical protein DAPPUDRAFT_303438 [Daphnia pulex]
MDSNIRLYNQRKGEVIGLEMCLERPGKKNFKGGNRTRDVRQRNQCYNPSDYKKKYLVNSLEKLALDIEIN